MHETHKSPAGYFRWLGIALIVFGVLALLTPMVAGSAVVIVIGCILLAAAVTSIVRGVQATTWQEKMPGITLGVIAGVTALGVIGYPLFGLAVLALLMAIYFVVEGVWKIVLSFRYRATRAWAWLLSSGALSLLLGSMIWLQWPLSGVWAVGLLVGVNLLGTGIALLLLSAALNALSDASTIVDV